MNNQDMPAHPQSGFSDVDTSWTSEDCGGVGETKREKAFWQVYSAINLHPSNHCFDYDALAISTVKIVNAGFRALGEDEA